MHRRNQLLRQVFVALIAAGGLIANDPPTGSGRAAAQTVGTGATAVSAGVKETKEGQPLDIYTLTADGTPASYDEAWLRPRCRGSSTANRPRLTYFRTRTAARSSGSTCSRRTALAPRTKAEEVGGPRRAGEARRGRTEGCSDLGSGRACQRQRGHHHGRHPRCRCAQSGGCGSPSRTWRLPVLKDLRGLFTGAETGSKKNDAYRWAIGSIWQKAIAPPSGCASSRIPFPPGRTATSATWSLAIGR